MYKAIVTVILGISIWNSAAADMAADSFVQDMSHLMSQEADTDDYQLGPGDVISITAGAVNEISLQYTVSESGKIIFPALLSPLEAQGLTVNDFCALLAEALAEYMYEPKVFVEIIEYHSHRVLMLGSFQRPGKYELKRERTPLLDVIMEAGGVTQLKETDQLVILRNQLHQKLDINDLPSLESMKPIQIDLQRLLRDGDLTQNVMVHAGDVIYITSFFATEQYVYVAGGGAIPYEPGLTAFKALLRAGVAPDDPQSLELLIVSGQQSRAERFITTQLNFDPMYSDDGDIPLFPEDIVIIPEDSSHVVYVTGEVNRPGVVPHREGLTVLQAILDSGGMTKDAVETKVKVLREGDDGRELIPVDMQAILGKGGETQNFSLMLGDIIVVPSISLQADIMVNGKVNKPGIVPYEEGMTALRAVFLTGGLRSGSLNSQVRVIGKDGTVQPTATIDITNVQIGEAGQNNPALSPGDLVVVMGTAPGNVISVLGKVRRPGIIQYEKGVTVLQAVLKAGGFDKAAARSKVRIVRGEDENQERIEVSIEDLLEKGDKTQNIALLPGDIVIVPQTFF